MSTLSQLLRAEPAATEPRVAPLGAETTATVVVPHTNPIHNEQIHALVQQLFFGRESGLVRHVGFAPLEASAQTTSLCLDVASVLAEEGSYDVGLIDAGSGPILLQHELDIAAPENGEATCPVASRLWLAPRQSWWQQFGHKPMTDQDLSRLRDLMTAFDFSVLCCPPISWQTARIGLNCDGLVLILTANKTRRLVAAQIRDQLSKARIPLLGTVLAERRFPVPRGLYRSL